MMKSKGHTVVIDPALHKVLKAKSIISGIPISELVNDAVCGEIVDDFREVEKIKIKNLLKKPF